MGPLRGCYRDTLPPGEGCPDQPRRDMEIITYVRRGAITHRDGLGNQGRTDAGDVQVMSAGTGILHSEFNLEDAPAQFLRICIEPTERGEGPYWGARPFPRGRRAGRIVTLASGFSSDRDALRLRAPARVLGATLKAGESCDYLLGTERRAWLVPAGGAVEIEGKIVSPGDGAAIHGTETLSVRALEDAEIVFVDVA